MSSSKSKSIDTKSLQSTVNDFIKLYNLELSDEDAIDGKRNVEKFLKDKIKKELDKYEF